MKVIYFSKGDERVASSRFRCVYFAEALRKEGFQVRLCEPPPRAWTFRNPAAAVREIYRLWRLLASVEADEIIYLQRPIQNSVFVVLLVVDKLIRGRTMVFDFCDPIFMHSPWKTRKLVSIADAVIVSCPELEDYARQHNENVHRVPNSLPDDQIRCLAPRQRETPEPVIGWIGNGLGHAESLRMLIPILSRLKERVTVRLVGMRGAESLKTEFRRLENLTVELVDWVEPDQVLSEIEAFDICLLPLKDSLWDRKLITKLLEYMALGRAVIASPVGENSRIIKDGENGFLASEEHEWLEKLRALVADPELRTRLGAAAVQTVSERFSLSRNGPKLAKILRGLSAGS